MSETVPSGAPEQAVPPVSTVPESSDVFVPRPKGRPLPRPANPRAQPMEWDRALLGDAVLPRLRVALQEMLRLEAEYVADVLKSPGCRLSGERLLMSGVKRDLNDPFAAAEVAATKSQVRVQLNELLSQTANRAIDAATCAPETVVENVRTIFAGLALIACVPHDPRAPGAIDALDKAFSALGTARVEIESVFRDEALRIQVLQAWSLKKLKLSGLRSFYA